MQSEQQVENAKMAVERVFSVEDVHPFDTLDWENRTAEIKDGSGRLIFRQEDCAVPKTWSQLATNIVASKYFYGEKGTDKRESSVRQLIHRVTRTITDWGKADGYFESDEHAERFYDELTALCVGQYGSFNSPVWFNVGLHHVYGISGSANNWRWDEDTQGAIEVQDAYLYPQASACFIQSVSDDMRDIMRLATSEAMLFKYGSGTGTDLSTLRSTKEKLAGGGKPSGPVSFMRVYDSIAGVIKSGGVTRRSAKMQTLRCDHPDIMDFVECKAKEDKKARALIEAGYEANFNGEAYGSVAFQNANLSVRLTDDFLMAYSGDGQWETKAVTTGKAVETFPASKIMKGIAEGTWSCGDPGVQYHDTIQAWHTCPNTAPINSSNPCSEYLFIDDSACNLASINLMKFRNEDGTFDAKRFRAACRIFITAQEILVDHSSYPTDLIAVNSHKFRPLGLGYANLGALLMSLGLPYDSDEGRALAGTITAIMTGQAYLTSSCHARNLGPFEGFAVNREPMLRVMGMHQDHVARIDASLVDPELLAEAEDVWGACVESGFEHGYRNSQVSVLAPTGTIAFMMDCDTTGVEPDIALVKYKSLAGGGNLKIVNKTVPMALGQLGYSKATIKSILEYIETTDMIEGCGLLHKGHLEIFDCAFAPAKGSRSISLYGHLNMMAAVQPFITGAISKTCNVPNSATVEEIEAAYLEGWQLGLKALAIYRDGSKGSQPLNTKAEESAKAKIVETVFEKIIERPRRERLPDTRQSMTHKFNIGGHKGYITVGLFPDGRPGELFVTMAKEGSTIGGLMDAIGTSISIGLQYGVPIEIFVKKFEHSRFDPSGFTKNPDIPMAKSVVDYLFRWLGMMFIPGYREANAPQRDVEEMLESAEVIVEEKVAVMAAPSTNGYHSPQDLQFAHFQSDAPACDNCGSITTRNGSCYKCWNCGNSMGCS